jgi:hypothetical protein
MHLTKCLNEKKKFIIKISFLTRQKFKVYLIMSISGGYLSVINMFGDPMESA